MTRAEVEEIIFETLQRCGVIDYTGCSDMPHIKERLDRLEGEAQMNEDFRKEAGDIISRVDFEQHQTAVKLTECLDKNIPLEENKDD